MQQTGRTENAGNAKEIQRNYKRKIWRYKISALICKADVSNFCEFKFYEIGGKYIMTEKRENPKQEKRNETVQFIVSRGFAGGQTMQEAFEQLIERQAYERFEERRERKAG